MIHPGGGWRGSGLCWRFRLKVSLHSAGIARRVLLSTFSWLPWSRGSSPHIQGLWSAATFHVGKRPGCGFRGHRAARGGDSWRPHPSTPVAELLIEPLTSLRSWHRPPSMPQVAKGSLLCLLWMSVPAPNATGLQLSLLPGYRKKQIKAKGRVLVSWDLP